MFEEPHPRRLSKWQKTLEPRRLSVHHVLLPSGKLNGLLSVKLIPRHPNVYGIDMPSPRELVAHGRTEPEIAEAIGADLVIYQTIEDLVQSCRSSNPAIETFDCSVFNGEYVTGGVDDRYLEHLDKLRSDNAKAKKKSVTISEAEEVSN